ncbi:MAG: error-prone DNA polymerase, partial [Terriglobales bacterium]
FIEVWHHFINQEAVIARGLLELSQATAIPYVVTNNVHYARPEKRIIHDVLTCIRHEVTLATAGRRLRPNGSWYMKSPEEMVHTWRDYPQGIKNTLVIAARCQFRHGLLKPPLPRFQIPEIYSSVASTHDELLEKLVWEGAAVRYGTLTEHHLKQLKHELSLISRMELAPYFLIMWDIVRFARANGIAVQGRGSAANSAVCYCLFITAVDPIGMDLLFERFLSEGRNEPPDIDLDIAHQERETVLQYVYEKYGREHAAMVCEVITYRGRSAVRDAARVLGFSQDQADRLATMSSYAEAREAAQHLVDGGVAAAGLDLRDRRVQLLIRIVAGLHQLPRHRSIHVGGFVLSGELLGDIVPIEP